MAYGGAHVLPKMSFDLSYEISKAAAADGPRIGDIKRYLSLQICLIYF